MKLNPPAKTNAKKAAAIVEWLASHGITGATEIAYAGPETGTEDGADADILGHRYLLELATDNGPQQTTVVIVEPCPVDL